MPRCVPDQVPQTEHVALVLSTLHSSLRRKPRN